jgi:hypothetical protein
LGSEIVEELPPNLTPKKFHSSYATEVERAEDGELVRGTTNAERAAYWQLYKARVVSRYYGSFVSKGNKERYMEMIRKAQELPSLSVEKGREEGEVRG